MESIEQRAFPDPSWANQSSLMNFWAEIQDGVSFSLILKSLSYGVVSGYVSHLVAEGA